MSRPEKSEKISITLPPSMLSEIKRRVEDGTYGSTSEVIREAMRLWQKNEEERNLRLAFFRERLERSMNSGEPIPLEEAFSRLEHRHIQRREEYTNENL